jgi:hypothetical protein
MYARICQLEILHSYIMEIGIGDFVSIEALITNPLDWHHFYEKLTSIRNGDRTDFTIVTNEGERIMGRGEITEVEKWSNQGRFGFKIKLKIRKQKSLIDRRVRLRNSNMSNLSDEQALKIHLSLEGTNPVRPTF